VGLQGVQGDVVDQAELLRLGGATESGLTDGKEGIGRWTEGSKAGTGYLGLPPIKGVKSGLMGATGRLFMGNPKQARSWIRRIQPRVGLRMIEFVLYSTLALIQTEL